MKHYCNPLNLPYKYQFTRDLAPQGELPPFKVYREAADPSLILFKDVYWLFPSMTLGFFCSEDLADWIYYPLQSDMPLYDYAPDVRVVGDHIVFCASHAGTPCDYFASPDPRTEPFEKIPGTFPFWDPNSFQDEDGKIYFYWGSSNTEPIFGVELDPDTLQPKTDPVGLVRGDEEKLGFERNGENHVAPKTQEEIDAQVEAMVQTIRQQTEAAGQDFSPQEAPLRAVLQNAFGNAPYLEGPWMTKHQGKYYLQVATAGTQYNAYNDAVFVSDSPLGPFEPAKNNPYCYQPQGFMTGSGHGSTLQDKQGDWWHIATLLVGRCQKFERRVGLWKAGFDPDGDLYCDQRFGDWPIALGAKAFDKPDMLLLSYGAKTTVSSGEGAENLTDENVRTVWTAATSQPGEYALVDLEEAKTVQAVQVNFGDDRWTVEKLPEGATTLTSFTEERWVDPVHQKTRWMMEGSLDGERWIILADKRQAETDLSHEFIELAESMELRYLRVTVEEVPYGCPACLSGIRVFGHGKHAAPVVAENVKAVVAVNGLDMDVSWEANGTVGAVVLWGYAPDKLYHSVMVYGKEAVRIGALMKGEPVYTRVDTFNDSGITEGKVFQVY